jgi:hypothetical protein
VTPEEITAKYVDATGQRHLQVSALGQTWIIIAPGYIDNTKKGSYQKNLSLEEKSFLPTFCIFFID